MREWASASETRAQSRRERLARPRCAACGAISGLDGHHAVYGRGRRARVVTLCRTCHTAVHTEARTMREPLEMVTTRYIRTHNRIIAASLRRADHDALRARQDVLRQREAGTRTVAP